MSITLLRMSNSINNKQKVITNNNSKRSYGKSAKQLQKNKYFEKMSGEKVLIITGATGELAPGLIEKALLRGYKIIACSRNPKQTSEHPEVLEFLKTDEKDLVNEDYWKKVFEIKGKDAKHLSVINLIGAAVPPPGKTLEDINVKPPLAIHKGLQNFADENRNTRSTMVHISSICATVLGNKHPYSEMRENVDKMLTVKTDRVSTTVLRPGLVFNNLHKNNMVNMGHPYSPEQFATLPIHPVIGSGDQIQQPVWQEDFSDAIINATDATEDRIIDAVGPESMTQSEMFEFFVDLRNGTFRKVKIPYEFGRVIANYFPKGRIAPYSIAAFEELEKDEHKKPLPTEPFEKLVGHPLSAMKDIYYIPTGEPIILARPPVVEHIKEIGKTLLTNNEARKDVLKVTLKHGAKIVYDAAKAFVKNN